MACSNEWRRFEQQSQKPAPKVHWIDRFECWLLGHEWPAYAVSEDAARWFPTARCRRCGVLMSHAQEKRND